MGTLMSNDELANSLAQMLRIDPGDPFRWVREAVLQEGRSEESVWEDLGQIRMHILKKVSVNVARNFFEQVPYYCGNERMNCLEMLFKGRVKRVLEIVSSHQF